MGKSSKLPLKCDLNEHAVQHQDIVVMGTDGLWDNLFEEDIKSCLRPHFSRTSGLDTSAASKCISTLAEAKSYDKTYDSPFAVEAKKHEQDEPGGKEDDITVIVSEVVPK
mmetsp:Transcript_9672/g.14718  ORF Transcript_9672/g.14718 Transcript_9672/m.14718 type:complete len:110 (-) Transcript_9672:17-346(-)